MSYLVRRSASDYAQLLLELLPPGDAYRATDPGLGPILDALGEEWARVEGRLLDLIDELDPTTAVELLDAWERVFGLPGDCDPSPPTSDADRQAALKARLVAVGGSQPAIIRQVIDSAHPDYVGAEIQIATLFRADESAADERCYDYDWTPSWWVWLSATPAVGWERLLCQLREIKPAHTTVHALDGADGGVDDVAWPI